MNRIVVSIAAFALLAAACSGSDSEGVASLESVDTTIAQEASVDTDINDEDALLEFSACLRENGIDDFQDPTINADGVPEFNLRDLGGDHDREEMQAAFEACQDHLDGIAFGPGSVDLTEMEDTLVEFSACMRDNGYNMPDPDLSNFGNGGGGEPGEGGGLFGGSLDRDDPDFISALEECQYLFENLSFGRGGGPAGGGGGGQ
jgi:hypothetical protein